MTSELIHDKNYYYGKLTPILILQLCLRPYTVKFMKSREDQQNNLDGEVSAY